MQKDENEHISKFTYTVVWYGFKSLPNFMSFLTDVIASIGN